MFGTRAGSHCSTAFAAVLLLATTSASVGAQTLSFGPTGAGGSGAWDNSTANWFNGSAAVPWVSGGTAAFGGTAGTVTVIGTVAVGGTTFSTNGYTITGGTLVLSSGAPTFTTDGGVSATIGSAISGSATLVKSGAGTLTFSGAQTYTGATIVDAGRLVLNNASGFVSATTVNSGATLSFTGTGNVTAAAAITLNDGAVLENSKSSGFAVLNGAVTSTGNTSINVNQAAGTGKGLYLDGGLKGSGTVTINTVNAGTSVALRTNSTTFSGTLIVNGIRNTAAGAGSGLALGGPGTSNALLHANVVLNGTIELADRGFGSGFGTSVFNMGALSGSGIMVGNRQTNGNWASTVVLGNTNDSGDFSGRIVRGSGITNVLGITKVGTGTQIFSGANGYTGVTNVNAGVLNIRNNTALGTTDRGTNVASGAALQIEGGIAIGAEALTLNGTGIANDGALRNMSGVNSYGGPITLGSAVRINSDAGMLTLGTITGAARNLTLGGAGGITVTGVLGITSGRLTKDGSGTAILTADNSYTGGTTITAGTLQLGNGGATGSIVGDVVDNGALAFDRSDTYSFSGLISGSGAVRQIGSGTTILTADNSYTGGTTIAAGTLQLGNGGTSGSILGDVVNDGTLAFDRSDTATFAGRISGSGAVRQISSGTTILTGDNSYTGGTTITAGTLQLGNGGTSGSIVGDVVDNGALAFNRSDTIAFGGVISGSGVVNQNGTGTTILTAVNPYTGGTNVNAGTLALPAGAALSGAGTAIVAPGATLGGYGSIGGTVINNGTIAVGNALPVFAGGPTGNFTILGSHTLINNGVVAIGAPGTPVGNTLTTISYVGGTGSSIRINTVLAGDGSPSDRLIVDGGVATGNSALVVTSAGGGGRLTTGDGIQVVAAINGSTTAAGSFMLAGPVAAGPYDYLLFRGGAGGSDPQSWFLRSTINCTQMPSDPICQVLVPSPPPGGGDVLVPNFRQEVSLYTAIPSMALLYGQALMGTLHQRVGEPEQIRGGQAQPFQGHSELGDLSGGETFSNGWGRLLMRHGSQDGGRSGVLGSNGPKFNYDLFALQAGTDIYRKESSDGSRDHGGAYVAFGQIDGDVWHYTRVRAGRDTLQAWSLGAYWTHFGAPGWYIDAVAQGTWYDAKSRSSRSFASLKTDGFGLAGSLEGGYPIALKPGWTIEPQAQLVYQRLWFDSANDGAVTVKFSNVESLGGRLGARLIATWQEAGEGAAAERRRLSVWLRANLWHEFLGKPRTTLSSADGPVPFRAAVGGTSVEFNVGVTAQFTRSMSFFASAGYQAGFERNAQAYEGRAGLRITW